jgi:hypothetical protein
MYYIGFFGEIVIYQKVIIMLGEMGTLGKIDTGNKFTMICCRKIAIEIINI